MTRLRNRFPFDLYHSELEEFEKSLGTFGLTAEKAREFMENPSVMKEWVTDGLKRLDSIWEPVVTYHLSPNWKVIEGTRDTRFRVREQTPELAAMMRPNDRYALIQVEDRYGGYGETHYIRQSKWKDAAYGVQMRLSGSSEVMVRLRAKTPETTPCESTTWGSTWSTTLGRGSLVSLGGGINATLASPAHSCYICNGCALMTLELVWARRKESVEMHLFDEAWETITSNMQIRFDGTTKNTIWVRERKS